MPHPCRGKLDGQREAIEADTDGGHNRSVGLRQVEVRLDGLGPCHEQANGLGSQQVGDGRDGAGIGQCQRRDWEAVFPGEV